MRVAELTAKGFTVTTLTLACLPLLGMRPAVLVVGLWVLSAAVYRAFHPTGSEAPDVRSFLLLASPFLLMLLDLLRAADPVAGWHIAERSGMLALAPLTVFLLRPPVTPALRDRAADVFALAAAVLALLANLRIAAMPLPDGIPFEHAYRAAFAAVSGIHPPYAAYFFLTGALLLVERTLRTAEHRLLRGATAVLLVLAGVLVASRTPLAAFVVAAFVLLLWRLPRALALRFAIILMVLTVALALLLPTSRQRITEVFTTELAMPGTATVNSVNERYAVAHCSLENLKRHWLVGMGQPAVRPALDACYARLDDPRYADGSHDTHCQPLHWWLSFGLIGLLLYAVLMLVPLRAALRLGAAQAAVVLVFFGVCGLTENVLARQWGVVTFAFLVSLFLPSVAAGGRSVRMRSHR
jgi:O-antigen ligase